MSISSDWFSLGSLKHSDRFQRIRNYNFKSIPWNLQQYSSLNKGYLVAISPFGGPVAICHDRMQLSAMNLQELFTIDIFTQSGKLIHRFQPQLKGVVICIDWLENENLVCITNSGYIYVYSIFGKELNCIPLSRIIDEDQIVRKCKIWAGGVIIIVQSEDMFLGYMISELISEEPICESLASFEDIMLDIGSPKSKLDQENDEEKYIDYFKLDGIIYDPIKMEIEVLISDKSVDVIIGYNKSILIANKEDIIVISNKIGKIEFISVSPSGEAIATYTKEGSLCVFPSDFSTEGNQFPLKKEGNVVPIQLAWCGDVALVVNFEIRSITSELKSKVLIISPSRDSHPLEYDGPVRILGEVDGVKVLFGLGCDFIHKVPKSLFSIFKIGSLEPGAILFDSYQNYLKANSSSIINVRSLEDKLIQEVETCLDAAGHSFDENTQDILLKAAEFGMQFPQFANGNHESFVQMCRTIRILNSVRRESLGIPISYQQYITLTPKVLINRLANRNQHAIAIKLCKYLSISEDNIILHWACAKVCSSESDDAILNSITDLKKTYKNLSFSTIASTAFRMKKLDLAVQLLDLEEHPGELVTLLLSMEKHKLAISKAIESGETDLIYLVLLRLMKSMNVKLFGLLSDPNFKVARNLLRSYCQIENQNFLNEFYQFQKLFGETAANRIQESFEENNVQKKKELLERARSEFAMDKVYAEDAIQTTWQIQLLHVQEQLDSILKERVFLNLSITDTIYKAFEIGTPEMILAAENIKRDFKVSDARYWWTAIRAMAKSNRWEELFQFSRKKSPIGYGPFVEVCIENENKYVQAFRYLDKVTDPEELVDFYCRLDDFNNAIKIGVEKKSYELLKSIASRATDVETRNQCLQYAEKFR